MSNVEDSYILFFMCADATNQTRAADTSVRLCYWRPYASVSYKTERQTDMLAIRVAQEFSEYTAEAYEMNPRKRELNAERVEKKPTFVSDGKVVGSMAATTGRVGHDADLYAVAKRRVHK